MKFHWAAPTHQFFLPQDWDYSRMMPHLAVINYFTIWILGIELRNPHFQGWLFSSAQLLTWHTLHKRTHTNQKHKKDSYFFKIGNPFIPSALISLDKFSGQSSLSFPIPPTLPAHTLQPWICHLLSVSVLTLRCPFSSVRTSQCRSAPASGMLVSSELCQLTDRENRTKD